MAQVLGFLVLVSGSSLYNELIRSCLPAVYPQPPSDDLDVRVPLLQSHCGKASRQPGLEAI